MGLGNWPEQECATCGRMISTYRDSRPGDDVAGAWDAKTETVYPHATGVLRLCHHIVDSKRCAGSLSIVGPALAKPSTPPRDDAE
jgi:hypothetical protein